MSSRCDTVTPSRFERRAPPGRHDLLFKVVFGSDGGLPVISTSAR
jgi:hypothetical protein